MSTSASLYDGRAIDVVVGIGVGVSVGAEEATVGAEERTVGVL